MKYTVHMLAFQKGLIREVYVPQEEADKTTDQEEILELIFKYGQNDLQSIPQCCSVSVGDVIDLGIEADERYHMVFPAGFCHISEERFKYFLSRSERGEAISIEAYMM